MIRIEAGIQAERIQEIAPSAIHGWCLLRVDVGGPRLDMRNPDAPLFHWVHGRLAEVAPLIWPSEDA